MHVEGRKIGRVNRRAAAMLWPLLADDIIWVEVKHTAARGEPRVSIYIFASLGQGPLAQVAALCFPKCEAPIVQHSSYQYFYRLRVLAILLKSNGIKFGLHMYARW